MKAKWIGLLLLIVVALGAVGYVWFSQSTQVTEITGYVGGEKIGLLEDEQVQKILKDKYRLSLDYNRAGSIEMVTTLDRAGQDFLFPSNQTALELFEGDHEKVKELERQGLVVKTQSAEDKRVFYLTINETLREEYKAYDRVLYAALDEVEATYSPEQVRLLCDMLDTISRRFEQENEKTERKSP